MRLIILNGPSGVGKSTTALKLQKEIPLSHLVEVDELRRSLPGYPERREETHRLAYEHTAEIIENELTSGHDVIIDKCITDSEILDWFAEIARKLGATEYEFLLFTDKATLRKRADARGYRAGGLLTPEKVDELWEKMDTLREKRPQAIVVDTTQVREIFEKVWSEIESPNKSK